MCSDSDSSPGSVCAVVSFGVLLCKGGMLTQEPFSKKKSCVSNEGWKEESQLQLRNVKWLYCEAKVGRGDGVGRPFFVASLGLLARSDIVDYTSRLFDLCLQNLSPLWKNIN